MPEPFPQPQATTKTEPSQKRQHLWDRIIRRVLPRSMFGRSLLIILIPLLFTQAISLELFYGTFLNIVSRRLTDMISGEISYTVDRFAQVKSDRERRDIVNQVQNFLQLDVSWHKDKPDLIKKQRHNIIGPVDEILDRTLSDRLGYPFYVDWVSDVEKVTIYVEMNDVTLRISTTRKRLGAGSLWLFVGWVVGSALLLFTIAALFVWIQVKAIRRLSNAVELFGKGRDPGPLWPVGAKEIKKAASAFNLMRDRILRFIRQRTVILASVSHDLRTPLTRIRLSLAMLPQKGIINAEEVAPDIHDIIADTEEMAQMIEGYLAFARGEGIEEPKITDMIQLIEDAVAAAKRAGTEFISVSIAANLPDIVVRAGGIRRVLNNILDNARRYGGAISLNASRRTHGITITIDDNGPGIAVEKREKLFNAFETGNAKKGTGLGLAIARDIIEAHGGEIKLNTSPLGGLRVVIFLPD